MCVPVQLAADIDGNVQRKKQVLGQSVSWSSRATALAGKRHFDTVEEATASLDALPLIHLQSFRQALLWQHSFPTNGIAVRTTNDLIIVFKYSCFNHQVDRLIEGLLRYEFFEIDFESYILVTKLLHDHPDRIHLLAIFRITRI